MTARVRLGTWIGASRALFEADTSERLKGLSVPVLVIWGIQDNFFLETPDQALLRASLDAAAATCRSAYFWKEYGREPLPASGNQGEDIGHNTQWGAPEAVAADLAAFLRPDGAPTRDLPYADPENPREIRVAPDQARVIEGACAR
jgi:pimeloyl-ACP methyl ester carboxylesterase